MKQKNNIIALIALCMLFVACNNDENGFKKHESGLEYKSIISSTAQKPQVGDVLVLDLKYETENGKIIFNSRNSDRKYLRKLEKPKHTGGSFEDGLKMLSVGDSAIFKINAENFLKFSELYENMPKDVKIDDNIIIYVKLLEILKSEDFDNHVGQKYHDSFETEMKILKKYISNAGIKVKPQESGLYYIEKVKGKGEKPKKGDVLTVNYTLKLIDGMVIETTLDKKPFSFKYGVDKLIPAWDEGFSFMQEGTQAVLICPSNIAYGDKGKNQIQAYSTLIFEVELISIN